MLHTRLSFGCRNCLSCCHQTLYPSSTGERERKGGREGGREGGKEGGREGGGRERERIKVC